MQRFAINFTSKYEPPSGERTFIKPTVENNTRVQPCTPKPRLGGARFANISEADCEYPRVGRSQQKPAMQTPAGVPCGTRPPRGRLRAAR